MERVVPHRMPHRVVQVSAPSRLHFGMFSFGRDDVRQFGGVGAMISSPGLQLTMSASQRLEVTGPLADRARRYAEFVAPKLTPARAAACRIEIESAPREHIGLGVGTQLGLAVAAGLCALFDLPMPEPKALAQLARINGLRHG